jgi:branched-chain amino acid aminotransferase
MLLNYNGKLIQRKDFADFNNRSFRYGDGLFESIRIINGELLFFHDHIQRLFSGMNVLKISIPEYWDANYLYYIVCELMASNQITDSGRIRIQVWRDGGGRYSPGSNLPAFLIEVQALEESHYQWLSEGLTVDTANSVRKSYDQLANIKTCSSLTYVMASIEAADRNLDETIIENAYGKIADTCTGNLFIIINGKVITPSLRDAPVAGVFRYNLMEMMRQERIICSEESISLAEVLASDEVFITNATRGIRPVASIRDKTFQSRMTKQLFDRFNRSLSATD